VRKSERVEVHRERETLIVDAHDAGRIQKRRASGIGSKAAKRDHFKTGQRAFVSETGSFLSFGDSD
jgi:hypothetical protein